MAIDFDKIRRNLQGGNDTKVSPRLDFDKIRSRIPKQPSKLETITKPNLFASTPVIPPAPVASPTPTVTKKPTSFKDVVKSDSLFSTLPFKHDPIKRREVTTKRDSSGRLINTFPEHIGGGVYYDTMADRPETTPRGDYGGVETKESFERDHITSLFLGGVDTKENIKLRQSGNLIERFLDTPVSQIPPERRQEGKVAKELEIYNKYKNNKISRAEAILELKRWEFEKELEVSALDVVADVPKRIFDGLVKSSKEFFTEALPTGAAVPAALYTVMSSPIEQLFLSSQKETLDIPFSETLKQNTEKALEIIKTKQPFAIQDAVDNYKQIRGIEDMSDMTISDALTIGGLYTAELLAPIPGANFASRLVLKTGLGGLRFAQFQKVGEVVREIPRAIRTVARGTKFEVPFKNGFIEVTPQNGQIKFVGYKPRFSEVQKADEIIKDLANSIGGAGKATQTEQGLVLQITPPAKPDVPTPKFPRTPEVVVPDVPEKPFTPPKTVDEVKGKTAESVISYINKDGEKVFTRLTPKELSVIKNEIKNIPQAEKGVSQIHLDAITPRQIEAGGKEVSRAEFIQGHPQAKNVFENVTSEPTKPPSVALEEKLTKTPEAQKELIQEARKYKTAEEFVKAQPKVFHGTDADFANFESKFLGSANGTAPINKTGFSFSSSPEVAKTFGKNTIEARVDIRNPFVIDAKGENYSTFKDKLNTQLKKVDRSKYDGIIIKNYADAGKYGDVAISDHYIPFSENQIKTKSQLTDIWEKANKVETKKLVKGEAKKEVKSTAQGKPEKKKPQLPPKPIKKQVDIGKAFSSHYEKIKGDLDATFADRLEFEKIDIKEEAKKAFNYIQRNPEKSSRIAYGLESSGNPVKDNAIKVSMIESLKEAGKLEQARIVARSLSEDLTQIGQALNIAKLDVVSGGVRKIEGMITKGRLERIGEKMPETVKPDGSKTTPIERGQQKVKSEAKKMADEVKAETKIKTPEDLLNMLAC